MFYRTIESALKNGEEKMPQATKQARLEARITHSTLAIVRRAAEMQGRSVSDFVVAAAEEMARKTIEDSHIITLAVEDQKRFAEALIAPPPLSPAMERAHIAHAKLIENTHVSD
jgi:uncharacterized protein (DUF1778 family)